MLGDNFSTVYDVAINILGVSSSMGKAKLEKCFSIYTDDLIDQWTRAFGEGFVLSRRSINQKIVKFLSDYNA